VIYLAYGLAGVFTLSVGVVAGVMLAMVRDDAEQTQRLTRDATSHRPSAAATDTEKGKA